MAHLHLRPMLRLLWRDRAVSAIAVVTLALGIGANTALFSVVNAVLLRALPYPAADRLVVVREVVDEFRDRYPSIPANAGHFAEWRRRCTSCEDLAAILTLKATLTGSGEPEELNTARVTANFFDFLGVRPALGRSFRAEDDHIGHEHVVLLSHGLWALRFGSDPSIVGRVIQLDGVPNEVIGVLPANARIPGAEQLGPLMRLPDHLEMFRPMAFTPDELASEGDYDYGALARLRPAASIAAARAELDGIEAAIARQSHDPVHLHAQVDALQATMVRDTRGPLVLLFGATAAVLLIVCVNLANLLLARHAGRHREAALRTALGATRRDLLWQGLAESLILAASGGILGLGIACAAAAWLVHTASAAMPGLDVSLDLRVVIFALAATGSAGLFVGIVPALRTTRVDPADSLKSSGYTATEGMRGGRSRRVLIAAQAAMSALLLAAAGLLIASFGRLIHTSKGFETAGVLTIDVALPPTVYPGRTQQTRFFDDMLGKLAALPGVQVAALGDRIPLQGEGGVNRLSLEHDPHPPLQRPLANYRYVSGSYFAAIGPRLLRGRAFTDADRGRQVVVLSAGAAETLWPGQDPIGRYVVTEGYLGARTEVVGVAADTRAVDLRRNDVLFAYLPYWLRGPAAASFVLRTTTDPASLIPLARRTIWSTDANIPIPRVRTMEQIVEAAVAARRFEMWLMSLFGAAAALLAGLGVYGVVSYSVARRRREMGIRVALGATRGNIHRLVIGEGLAPVVAGLSVGLTASLALGRAMGSRLFDVRPGDPATMAAAACVLIAAAAAACVGPALRASSRVDITTDLR